MGAPERPRFDVLAFQGFDNITPRRNPKFTVDHTQGCLVGFAEIDVPDGFTADGEPFDSVSVKDSVRRQEGRILPRIPFAVGFQSDSQSAPVSAPKADVRVFKDGMLYMVGFLSVGGGAWCAPTIEVLYSAIRFRRNCHSGVFVGTSTDGVCRSPSVQRTHIPSFVNPSHTV